MSETDALPTEPMEPEPGTEPAPEPAEPTEPAEPSEPSEPPTEGEPPANPAESEPETVVQGPTEAEIEKVGKQLEALRKHVARKVGDIFGEDAVALIPCPLCGDDAPGHVWMQIPGEVKDEAMARVHAWLGIASPVELEAHPNAELCPTCKGKGQVRTPSQVPGYDVVDCPNCAATGRVLTQAAPPSQQTGPLAPVQQLPVAPANGGSDLPPELQALKDEGWMIAPPIQMPTVPPQG